MDARRATIEAAARRRGVDLAHDDEARWCAGVMLAAPADAVQRALLRPPLRVLELADALHLDPDSVNDVYSEWIINGGTATPALPDWVYDPSQVRPWRSDIGPPPGGAQAFSAPVGEPVRLPSMPRPRAAPTGPFSAGGIMFMGFVLLTIVCLFLKFTDPSRDQALANDTRFPPGFTMPPDRFLPPQVRPPPPSAPHRQ